jgi:hypothetical protein
VLGLGGLCFEIVEEPFPAHLVSLLRSTARRYTCALADPVVDTT